MTTQLRIVRREAREQSGDATRLVARAGHLLRDVGKLGDVAARQVEHLDLEAAERREALNRRRRHRNHQRAGNAEHLAAQAVQHASERVLRPLALVEPLSRVNISPLFDAAPLKLKPATEKTAAISGCLK